MSARALPLSLRKTATLLFSPQKQSKVKSSNAGELLVPVSMNAKPEVRSSREQLPRACSLRRCPLSLVPWLTQLGARRVPSRQRFALLFRPGSRGEPGHVFQQHVQVLPQPRVAVDRFDRCRAPPHPGLHGRPFELQNYLRTHVGFRVYIYVDVGGIITSHRSVLFSRSGRATHRHTTLLALPCFYMFSGTLRAWCIQCLPG